MLKYTLFTLSRCWSGIIGGDQSAAVVLGKASFPGGVVHIHSRVSRRARVLFNYSGSVHIIHIHVHHHIPITSREIVVMRMVMVHVEMVVLRWFHKWFLVFHIITSTTATTIRGNSHSHRHHFRFPDVFRCGIPKFQVVVVVLSVMEREPITCSWEFSSRLDLLPEYHGSEEEKEDQDDCNERAYHRSNDDCR